MLGVLLESKARKQRRGGGAALSVCAHVMIIGAVVVGTVQGKSAPPVTKPEVFHIVPLRPREIKTAPQHSAQTTSSVPTVPTNVVVRHIDAPTITPTELPPIDMTRGGSGDSIVVGGAPSGPPGGFGSMFSAQPTDDDRSWNVRDVLMHVLTPAKPRYPESLRSAGVDGRVLVEFTVDTTGRVDPASMKVLESTHDLFTRAVRDAIGNFRFRPAEVGGRRVAALAQMPFEFHIDR